MSAPPPSSPQVMTCKADSMDRFLQVVHSVVLKSCRRVSQLFCCPLDSLLDDKLTRWPGENTLWKIQRPHCWCLCLQMPQKKVTDCSFVCTDMHESNKNVSLSLSAFLKLGIGSLQWMNLHQVCVTFLLMVFLPSTIFFCVILCWFFSYVSWEMPFSQFLLFPALFLHSFRRMCM